MMHSCPLQYLLPDGDETEIECDVEWEGEPETPPITSGPPDAWDPGDAGYFDIIRITVSQDYPELGLKENAEITIDQVRETEKELEETIIEAVSEPDCEPDDYDDYDDPAHDYIYEGPAGW